jgi:signal transduction histidine kinase
MQELIFSSKLTLKLANEEIQEQFDEEKLNSIKKTSKIFIYIIFLYSIATTVVNSIVNFYLGKAYPNKWLVTISFYCCVLLSVIIILLNRFIKNKRFTKAINYLNYLLFGFVMMNVRFPFFLSRNYSYLIFCPVAALEMSFRLFWKTTCYLSFKEILILNPLLFIIIILFYSISEIGKIEYLWIIMTYFVLQWVFAIMVYLADKNEKEIFYLIKNTEMKNEKLLSILENMNAGHLYLKNGDINYINKYLYNKLANVESIANRIRWFEQQNNNGGAVDIPNNPKETFLNNSSFIVKELFSNIEYNGNNKPIEDMLLKTENLIKDWRDSDKNFILRFIDEIDLKISDGYVFIGDKEITLKDESTSIIVNFEVFCRKRYENELEFLFNDVTRSRKIEQQNAKIKYRTLFLSKIAHEFKNPLIAIYELVENSKEQISKLCVGENSNINMTFNQIQAISNYLLILVKDLDFFSQSEMDKSVTIDKHPRPLKETVEFCTDVAGSLLARFGKAQSVVFKVIKDVDVPELLCTDHSRLKQILINLISNAIKFTNTGLVLLKINLENIEGEIFVKFLVKDTGIGLKEDQLYQLFNPYNKGKGSCNDSGAGLGLCIVRDLIELLGGVIAFSSKLGEGTSFWFSLKFENNLSGLEYYDSYMQLTSAVKSQKTEEILANHDIMMPSSSFHLSGLTTTYSGNTATALSEIGYNILIVDDEEIIRQSLSNMLTKLARELNININIVQAQDGIECLYLVYNSIKLGIKVVLILSDQTLQHMNGVECSKEVYKLTSKVNQNIPFYLVTAYEDKTLLSGLDCITGIISKPLNVAQAKLILTNLKL